MTSFKPAVDHDAVVALLGRHLPHPIRDERPVAGGNVARIFACTAGADGEGFIIRFGYRHAASFAKEAHIARALAPTGVPIPAILHLGEHGDLRFAISRLAPGTTYDGLPPAVGHAMLPALIETLEAIHAVDVGDTTGFGTFDDRGAGMFPSWRRFLESVREEETGRGYYGAWHRLFETTFLDRATFDTLYEGMVELLPFCPEERFLVHGDFGFDNLLVEDGWITAVLDWADAKYGDRLYDVAWLAFWAADPDSPDFAAIFADHYARRGITMTHYAERITCYQHRIALDGCRYSAKANDEWGYRWMLERLRALQPLGGRA